MEIYFTEKLEHFFPDCSYVMRYAIWYHLYNLRNVKNTHGEVLLLAVKLQAKATSMGVFHVF